MEMFYSSGRTLQCMYLCCALKNDAAYFTYAPYRMLSFLAQTLNFVLRSTYVVTLEEYVCISHVRVLFLFLCKRWLLSKEFSPSQNSLLTFPLCAALIFQQILFIFQTFIFENRAPETNLTRECVQKKNELSLEKEFNNFRRAGKLVCVCVFVYIHFLFFRCVNVSHFVSQKTHTILCVGIMEKFVKIVFRLSM